MLLSRTPPALIILLSLQKNRMLMFMAIKFVAIGKLVAAKPFTNSILIQKRMVLLIILIHGFTVVEVIIQVVVLAYIGPILAMAVLLDHTSPFASRSRRHHTIKAHLA